MSDFINKKRAKKLKKSFIRNGFVLINIAVILTAIGFVLVGHNNSVRQNQSLFSQASNGQSDVPLDTISSADIAANIARVASLPEAVTVTNQADSYNAQVASANVNQSIVTKPSLVAGGTKSRKDIISYVTVAGDTVSSLATKFGVTSDSIRWSNGLSGDSLSAGKTLLIPPKNGIVYKVKSGDTVNSLAAQFNADVNQIIEFNDTEIDGLPVGEYVLIPDGTQSSSSSGSTSSSVYNFSPDWGGNGYTFGYCTYYAASKVSVPRNWGNANTWAYYARLSGWTVSSKPIPGAIAQSPYMSYWGHVAYVEAVSPDGTMMKYSDMNGLAGWDRIGYSNWVPISTFPNYIYQ